MHVAHTPKIIDLHQTNFANEVMTNGNDLPPPEIWPDILKTAPGIRS